MDKIQSALDMVTIYLWGVSGGLAHLFVSGKRPSFYSLLSCIFVAGFAGLMANRLMEASALPSYLKEMVTGMAGFGGPVTLHIFYRKMVKSCFGVTDKDIDRARADHETETDDKF